MPAVEDNIDHFLVHPTYALAALLPDREHVDRMLETLPEQVSGMPPVQILHGEQGLRILDQRGNAHGRLAWFHRLLQNWTYYEQILGLYGEGLQRGDFLTVIPCAPEQRHQTAVVAASHGGHSLYYFGFETVESVG